MRNAISDKHHGVYGKRGQLQNEQITYDFSEEHLSPEGERQALLAISFIEGMTSGLSDRKKPKLISKGHSGRQLQRTIPFFLYGLMLRCKC